MKQYYNFSIDYYQDEDGIFTAVVPLLPGCVASGKALEEAYHNIRDAIESCLEVRNKLGMPVNKDKYCSAGTSTCRVYFNGWFEASA